MGIHLDTLIGLIETRVGEDEGCPEIPKVKEYISELVQNAALFEFSLPSNQLLPRSGKEKEEYDRYIDDYFELSAKHGEFLALPFEVTAIEDFDTVVIMNYLGENNYMVISAGSNCDTPGLAFENILVGQISIYPELTQEMGNKGIPMKVRPVYSKILCNGDIINEDHMNNPQGIYYLSMDLINASVTYIEEVTYLMDPENFIINRQNGKNIDTNGHLKRTNDRPVFFALDKDRTKTFLENRAIEPQSVELVRGCWNAPMSERYSNDRQMAYVKQHYKGNGSIEGKDGNRYQVWVKRDPVTIEPFHAVKQNTMPIKK